MGTHAHSETAFLVTLEEFYALLKPAHLAGMRVDVPRLIRLRQDGNEWGRTYGQSLAALSKKEKAQAEKYAQNFIGANSLDAVVQLLRGLVDRSIKANGPEIQEDNLLQLVFSCVCQVVLPLKPQCVTIVGDVDTGDFPPTGKPLLWFSFDDCFSVEMTAGGRQLACTLGKDEIEPLSWTSMSRQSLGPAARVSPGDQAKIQGLLESKTSDGVMLGLSLLESLGATRADYAAVFTETVKKAVSRIVNDWLQGGDATRAEYSRYHTAVLRPVFLAARGHQRTQYEFLASTLKVAAAAGPKQSFIDLVNIPAGAFTMGSPEDEPDRESDETQVQVRITKPFAIGRTVVTQGQWRAVMGTEPWYEGLSKNQCGDDFPAVYVSWHDAVLFCETLTDLERDTGRLTATQSYRLPTEAEWEYACRADTTTAYSFGDDPKQLGNYGWYCGSSDLMLQRVAEMKPNPWGLFDMHGNVWEWCADWEDEDDGQAGGDDPAGPATGSERVARGGDYHDNASCCRSAYRGMYPPWRRHNSVGFRVVVLR